ncbi:F-box only protein 30-like isoform X2 [Mercenaria mercenaria]|uniref:F-box only protein 30-like isoform X2 n=1 Tax=Mercenaria mercenaria TaxID=6596 RepID=UPI00234EABF8|nr:F-box only protein 30-like isoform X2 [Mercenaria mercenaria]
MAASHEHCTSCHRMNCMMKPDDITSCALIYCQAGCGFRFHNCKSEDHKKICLKEKVPCINFVNGCPIELTREKISGHLPVCPASVVLCPREWNRWPMHSQDKGWKAPMPFKNPHVKCGQIDVAFALRDQRMLMDSFKTPRKTRRILRNPLTQCYPAVPIQSHSSVLDSPTSETSQLSDDESGTPWDLTQSPPGLQQTILNQLSSNSTNQLYAASKQTTESLTKALDYVTGRQGLKRLAEIAKMKEMSSNTDQDTDQINKKLEATNIHDSNNTSSDISYMQNDSPLTANNNEEEDELEVFYTEKKLFEILGLDLTMHFISSYQPKPLKMFTFLCGREFRRDEYPWHVKNFHSDIQCNLNSWFEQRCPLSYLGCTFAFQRFKPKNPTGVIVHSPVLQSFGLCEEEQFETSRDRSEKNLTEEEDIRTTTGRKRLREATPEILTSYKCDSVVRVIPRYKSESREVSPVKLQKEFDGHLHSLTDLPFEVLQNIARNLDSFSIQHLSMTCKLLQSVCCSLLDERGIVSLVWEKRSPAGSGPLWNVTYKRWQFSTSFSPILDWDFKENGSPIQEHLKICPFNQHVDKNVKEEPFQMIYDFADDERFSHGQDMFDKRKKY